uniref:hypothetical protein n=1 Tax=Nonomuraea pusilla TaxID=46177 RepID=UPI0006E249BD|nr:hypothetical protein [Nonomuraea pusilla]
MVVPSWRPAAAGAAAFAVAALLAPPAHARPPAPPPSACGAPVDRQLGDVAVTMQLCPDWAPAGRIPVHSGTRPAGAKVVGWIDPAGDGWYECGMRGDPYRGIPGAVSRWWAAAMADNGRWGYVSQLYLQGGREGDPEQSLRRC